MGAVGNVLAWPFRNPEEQRLRWGWRFFIPVFLSVVFLFVTSMFGESLAPLFTPLMPSEYPALGEWWVSSIILRVLLGLCLLLVWAWFVDRRRIADYGFHIDREWWIHLLGGLLIGAFFPVAAFLTRISLGWATITEVATPSASLIFGVGIVFVFIFGVVFWEETLYRGLALKNAAEGIRSMGLSPRGAVLSAWLLISLAFTLFHVLLGAGWSTFVWYMAGSLSLGLVYVFTGELAFPMGMHHMSNFLALTAFPIEDDPDFPTVMNLESTGAAPEMLAGETGLLEVAMIGIAMLLMLFWVRWRKGNLKLKTDLTEWTPRGAEKPPGSGRVR